MENLISDLIKKQAWVEIGDYKSKTVHFNDTKKAVITVDIDIDFHTDEKKAPKEIDSIVKDLGKRINKAIKEWQEDTKKDLLSKDIMLDIKAVMTEQKGK